MTNGPRNTDKLYEKYLLLISTVAVMRRVRRFELYRLGLKTGFTGISSFIAKGGNCATVTDLAALSHLQAHTVTEMVNRMEKAGLVSKERDSRDKRIVRVTLTEKGKQTNKLVSAHREFIRESLGCLSAEELDQLSAYLERLRDKALELEKRTSLKLGRRYKEPLISVGEAAE